jgi:vacuolar protein sorting-associated protein 72
MSNTRNDDDEQLPNAASPTNIDHVTEEEEEEDDYDDENEDNTDNVEGGPQQPSPTIVPAPLMQVESLVAGRARRSTAGNRLATLLHQEADAEDTLFLEDEDDVEFAAGEVEDMSDVQLESSSEDEDDAGPPAMNENGEQVDEDMEGERELQRIAKEAHAVKKRRAGEAFLKPRKRVTIKDPSTTTSTNAGASAQDSTETPSTDSSLRPRKKSERISWLPQDVYAVRASSRTLSLQNRTETMKRLEESEKRRLRTIKLMEAAAAKKDKTNPRVMTQEDRLREAKLTEEKNLKSLNRWEQNEAYRLEEQRKKLAALQNRRLVGPVVTFWSGTAEWDEKGKLMRVGKGLIEIIDGNDEGEGKKGKGRDEKRKSNKARSTAISKAKGKEKATPEGEVDSSLQEVRQQDANIMPHSGKNSNLPSPQPPLSTSPSRPTSSTSDNQNPALSSGPTLLAPTPPDAASQSQVIRSNGALPMLLEGILEYAALPDPSETKGPPPVKTTGEPAGESTTPTPLQAQVEPPRPKTEASTRNLVVLENFDAPDVQTREGVIKVLFPSESKRSWREYSIFSPSTLSFQVGIVIKFFFIFPRSFRALHAHSQFRVPIVRSGPSLTGV